ncbi:hypothetical protein PsorP6_010945 [Peronosclerospora sorghi]|uniref:Uncharacterized protein n=1 Tax=Peronosclerospora sorghi TaxID=230839 RepID=A0ACC0VX02_9STRA|nr:hypothetical protein PsorP6_010945 [Peronosclerospora sorghi]
MTATDEGLAQEWCVNMPNGRGSRNSTRKFSSPELRKRSSWFNITTHTVAAALTDSVCEDVCDNLSSTFPGVPKSVAVSDSVTPITHRCEFMPF